MGKKMSKKIVGISKRNSNCSNSTNHEKKNLNHLVKVLKPRVYITDPSNFKSLVQELTGNEIAIPPPVLISSQSSISSIISQLAIYDKIKQSAEGAIQAVVEFVTKRGKDLNESAISRTAQSLLTATVHVTEKYLRQEILGAISNLAETTSSIIVFSEVLTSAGRDIVTKDISRLRGGWPMQDAFYEHPEWDIQNGYVIFQKAKESAPCKEIPSLQLITQTLGYARELERIVSC